MNKVEKAQRLLTGMLTLDLHPDNFTYVAFIKALCGSRRYHDAKELFLSMEANGCIPDAYLCNSYIDALIKSGRVKEAQNIDTNYMAAITSYAVENFAMSMIRRRPQNQPENDAAAQDTKLSEHQECLKSCCPCLGNELDEKL
ncbi:hypothetical protein Fot_52130 [Forsythia ovata]|uniref:Pentatricopeptide repeat-containing protein n=1 Tax=Forsythia ovata TaxID=205694 RepID=A0ABD1PKM6_9LAMI